MSSTRSSEKAVPRKKSRTRGQENEENDAAVPTAYTVTLFDTDKLIEEIKKRPAIYAQNTEEYLDRNVKSEAWNQICQIMIPKWDSFSDERKNEDEKLLKGKWRNIRDYFVKELKIQNSKSANNKKRKKYVYFEKLLFLKPSAGKRMKQLDENDDKSEENEAAGSEVMFVEYQMPSATISGEYSGNQHDVNNGYVALDGYPKSICETKMSPEVEDALVNPECMNQREEDYDKMFLLSLLPTLRKVPEDKKLDVRIEMTQVLAKATRNVTCDDQNH